MNQIREGYVKQKLGGMIVNVKITEMVTTTSGTGNLNPDPFDSLCDKLDLAIIYAVLFSIYLITTGIFKHKRGISEIIFGSILLACSLIWVLINKLPLTSFETIIFIIIALLFITGGIFVYLGYIPEKWIKIYGIRF